MPSSALRFRSAACLLTLIALAACGGGDQNGPGQDFTPSANTTLTGSVSYRNVTIPAGVTVTVTGSLVLTVTGTASIAGTLTGDCTRIEIRVTGSLTLNGLIANACTTAPAGQAPGIKLVADGGYTIGTTVSTQDAIVSDGSVRITDTATENESFTPLPVPFGTIASPGGSDVKAPFAPQRLGAGGTVNRPVRAGKGESTDITAEGPVTIGPGQPPAKPGKDAPAKTLAGTCDNSSNIGGTGGSVRLLALNSTLTINGNLQAGNGGAGGSCNAPSGCPSTAIGGMGGDGGSILLGATTIVFGAGVSLIRGSGGIGGDATAKGDDGPAACANGCAATATAGKGGGTGGIGYIHNVPGGITGNPSESGADGGTGGFATATAGHGKDCTVCPAGKGGDGGVATATGGNGGNGAASSIFLMAPASHRKGNGGGANALGGNGGKGSNCCTTQPGGAGGKGGNAISTSGQIGAVGVGGNGVRGNDFGQAGNGANGGDGTGPGAGGAQGTGLGLPNPVPDGVPGIAGNPCPVIIIVLPGGITVVIQGGTITISVQVNRTNFTGAVNVEIKDQNGTVRGQGTIPAGQSSGSVQISVPSNFSPGTFTWTATASGTNVSDTKTFQVQVNVPQGVSIAPNPLSDTKNQGASGSFTANVTKNGGFNGALTWFFKKPDGTIIAQGTMPAGNSSFSVSYTIAADQALGTNNYSLLVQGAGIPDVTTTFPITVTQPSQPDEVRLVIQPPGIIGAVAQGTYQANLQDVATGAIVGTAQVKAIGPATFRAESPTRTGAGAGSSWSAIISSAIVNGAKFVVGKWKECILNASKVSASNPLKLNHKNKAGTVTKTKLITGEGCYDEDLASDDDEIETTGPQNSGDFQDSKSKHYRRNGAPVSPAPPPAIRRP